LKTKSDFSFHGAEFVVSYSVVTKAIQCLVGRAASQPQLTPSACQQSRQTGSVIRTQSIMSRIKHALLLFAAPASWFALIGIVMLISLTPWGAGGGHVSNGAFLFILSFMAAPFLASLVASMLIQ
jgi:hypothetical protein